MLARFEDGRERLRFTSGALAGRTVIAYNGESSIRPYQSPSQRAEELLLRLLDERQAEEWRARAAFTVDTPFGVVELGRLQDLTYWPRDCLGEIYRLCVVPTDMRMSPPDIWTNLLLILRTEPARFFRVANWAKLPNWTWSEAPPPPVIGMLDLPLAPQQELG